MSHRIETLADGVTLHLGDCREILPTLKADAVVTDPPYGVSYSSGWDNKFKKIKIANDTTTEARDWVVGWLADRPACAARSNGPSDKPSRLLIQRDVRLRFGWLVMSQPSIATVRRAIS